MSANDLAGPTQGAPRSGRTEALARKAWASERQYRFGVARRYSRFVEVMKLALPLLAVALLVLMIGWSTLHKSPIDLSWQGDIRKISEGKIEMVKPRLSFTDDKDRTILVEAEIATQTAGKRNLWSLDTLTAHVTPPTGAGYMLRSDHGNLDSESQQLDLMGNVLVESSQGYTFKAKSAHVDMKENRVTSEEPVEAQGGATHIVANRFEMWDRGARFRFEGDVHFKSEPVAKKAGSDGQQGG